MKKILIFPCGSEIAREVLEALKNNKDYFIYGGTSIPDKGEYLPYDKIIKGIPFITDNDFILNINNILTKYQIDYIFPCHDDVSLILSANKNNIKSKIITHDYEINNICRNKDKTYETFNGYFFVPSYEHINFPRFVKPKNSNGSKGAKLINNEEELNVYYEEYSKINTLELEYLPGSEYTIDCFSQNGNLLFIGARERNTSKMGIAEISTHFYDKEIDNIAKLINDKIKSTTKIGFDGAWFFQLKKDINNKYKLLEIGSRISGGMSFYRMSGINFPELSLLRTNNIECNIYKSNIPYVKSFSKFFIPIFKHNIGDYDKVYIDFDDTLFFHKTNTINTELIKFLFQELDKNKKLILITRSTNNFQNILKQYRIENLFDSIIHIKNKDQPKEYFIQPYSVFIDDSFKERNFNKPNIYCFGLDNFKLLIND